MAIKIGDIVKRAADIKKPKHQRNGVGGNAAYWLSADTPYRVRATTLTGSLFLDGFKLPVSIHDVVLQLN